MCALLTTTPVAPSIHSAVWELNVHVCRVCMHLYVCLPASVLPYLVSQPCCFMHVAFDAPGARVCSWLLLSIQVSVCVSAHVLYGFPLHYLMPRKYSVGIRRPATSAEPAQGAERGPFLILLSAPAISDCLPASQLIHSVSLLPLLLSLARSLAHFLSLYVYLVQFSF